MKTTASILLSLSLFAQGFAQTEPVLLEKGAAPLVHPRAEPVRPPGAVRALIVGISDYANEGIKDLRFADRDAQVFHDFLRSKAGGEVPEENIILRKNSEATNGTILDDLFFLKKTAKKGDLVIIYFSGHGDVERETLWQLGYLLCHDTPYNNYPNNAVELEFLNKMVMTLSVGTEARVLLILDACHSGKLAGGENLGPSLTAAQAAVQKANEVRILSCQSDQLSIEGERWGGGRGVFSYYLINGLKGLADEEADGSVVLFELKNYLRANMRRAIQQSGLNHEQTAVFAGQDEYFRLASVDSAALAGARVEVAQPVPVTAAAIGTAGTKEPYFARKGAGEAVGLSALDAFSKVVDERLGQGVAYFFSRKKAVEDGRAHAGQRPADETFRVGDPHEQPSFLPISKKGFEELMAPFLKDFGQKDALQKYDEATREGIGQFVELAKRAKTDPALRALFSQKLAVRLHDLAQKAINLYLDGDAGELARRYFKNQTAILEQYPLMLLAATELLPEDHPLIPVCEVKHHYFNGLCQRLRAQLAGQPTPAQIDFAIAEQRASEKLDPRAAYVQNELGILFLMKKEEAAARDFFKKATELAPTWAIAHSNLGAAQLLLGQQDSARASAARAIQLRPEYFGARLTLADFFEKKGDLLSAETALREAKRLNNLHYIAFEKLAFLLLKSARYDEAELRFKEADERRAGILAGPSAYNWVLPRTVHVDAPFFKLWPPGPSRLLDNPVTAEDFYQNGLYYFHKKQAADAERCFNRAVHIDPGHLGANQILADMLEEQARWGEAEILYLKLEELADSADLRPTFDLARLYRKWGRPDREEEELNWLLEAEEAGPMERADALSQLADLYRKQGRHHEEERALWRWVNEAGGQPKEIKELYERMAEKYPASADWAYKRAHFNDHRIDLYERVIELDTAFAARAFVEKRLGELYFEKAAGQPKAEADTLWLDFLEKSTAHFEQSVARAPGEVGQKFGLASAYLMGFRFEDATNLLEKTNGAGLLDFENVLRLADLRARWSRLDEADSLLKKAFYMQPHELEIAGLPEALARYHFFKGEDEAALGLFKKEFDLDPEADQPGLCYTIARLHARLGHKKEALDWLQNALAAGFKCGRVIKYDPDWEGLRGEERFGQVVASARFE